MSPGDRRRLDLVAHGATKRRKALYCDATLLSPVRSDGRPHASAADRDGVALSTAERRKRARYPELDQPGPQRLDVLAAEVGGRWHAAAPAFVRQLARVRARRAPPAVRRVACAGWSRRSSRRGATRGCSTVLDRWVSPPLPAGGAGPLLGEALWLAECAPSSPPLRG